MKSVLKVSDYYTKEQVTAYFNYCNATDRKVSMSDFIEFVEEMAEYLPSPEEIPSFVQRN